jgi:hypothetical protein
MLSSHLNLSTLSFVFSVVRVKSSENLFLALRFFNYLPSFQQVCEATSLIQQD